MIQYLFICLLLHILHTGRERTCRVVSQSVESSTFLPVMVDALGKLMFVYLSGGAAGLVPTPDVLSLGFVCRSAPLP